MRKNPIFNGDSYKFGHWPQYPSGTEYVYAYIESRGGKYANSLFFGLQAFIKEYMSTPFTKADIDEAEILITAHGEPFNRAGFEYILKRYNGYWPVRIRSVREGSIVPVGNVLVDIINTDPLCYWVPSFLETQLLRGIWYPTTVATQEYYLKKVIAKYLEETSDDSAMDGIGFKMNDFGSRGVSSYESAVLGGLAHLVTFQGTDNVVAVKGAVDYYNQKLEIPAGFSIVAAEHSTMTSWGGRSGEVDAMRNMVNKFCKPGALVAVVSDSYDIYNAVENYWGDQLLEDVKNSGATIVVRPDSGDALTVPVEVIDRLEKKVGGTINTKGYRMLPSYYRAIQGDGIDDSSLPIILENMKKKKLATDNLAFGMGGGLLQKVDRDTMEFAMKTSCVIINGKSRDVFKDPIAGGKTSKKGMLDLIREGNTYRTVPYGSWHESGYSVMRTVYDNCKLQIDETFDEIKARVTL